MTSSQFSFLDRFIRASAGYIIPAVLLVANLAAYLNKDQSRPYDILVINAFANFFLLYAYLRGDRTALNTRRNSAVPS
ncbi:hypothetical protein DER45DRAFT_595024 [Fusarium avenaceum]|nr:hypothetical protein DER45DRAFT_595024 [Fusarium avenaceum]